MNPQTHTEMADDLVAALKTMIEFYWGDGDGYEPPDFIREAQILVEEYERANARR